MSKNTKNKAKKVAEISAKQMIQKQVEKDVTACIKEVNESLEKYDCAIDGTVSFSQRGGMKFRYDIVHK